MFLNHVFSDKWCSILTFSKHSQAIESCLLPKATKTAFWMVVLLDRAAGITVRRTIETCCFSVTDGSSNAIGLNTFQLLTSIWLMSCFYGLIHVTGLLSTCTLSIWVRSPDLSLLTGWKCRLFSTHTASKVQRHQLPPGFVITTRTEAFFLPLSIIADRQYEWQWTVNLFTQNSLNSHIPQAPRTLLSFGVHHLKTARSLKHFFFCFNV